MVALRERVCPAQNRKEITVLPKKFTRKLIVAISLFALLSYGGKAVAQCNSVQLSVGDVSARVSRANENFDFTVDVTGCTNGTAVNGFTMGIGYDSGKLTFVSGAAGAFVNTQGGVGTNDDTLSFSATAATSVDGTATSYIDLSAYFDTAAAGKPAAIPADTVLATLTFRIITGTATGTTPLTNATNTYGVFPGLGISIANVYKLANGTAVVPASLPDGTITMLENVKPGFS